MRVQPSLLDRARARTRPQASPPRHRSRVGLAEAGAWAIFDRSLDGLLLTNEALEVVDANAAACAILHREATEVLGQPVRAFLPEGDRDGHEARLATFRSAGLIDRDERMILLPDGSTRLVELNGSASVLPGVHLFSLRDVEGRRRAEEAVRFLEEASRRFASTLEPEQTLAAVVRLAVPRLSDWAAVDMLEPDRKIRRVIVQHSDPEKVALAYAMRDRRPASLGPDGGVGTVLLSGVSMLVEEITDAMLERALGADPEYLAMTRQAGLRSLMIVPLLVQGSPRGTITFAFSESRRRFARDDVAFAEELARRAGTAFENALAYRELRDAMDEQVRLRRRTERLFRLASALASSMSSHQVADMFTARGREAVDAEQVTVFLLDANENSLVPTAWTGDEPSPPHGGPITLKDPSPVAEAARAKAPLVVGATTGAPPDAIDAHVPLVAGQDVVGVASFRLRRPAPLAIDDLQLLVAVADQCAVALDRARAYEAEAVALRKKDEFLAMLGHELRNPIAPILTATSVIRLRGVAGERELDILERQGRHLVRLVDDLLDVSRIASGKLALRRKAVEVGDVVAQAVESIGGILEDKGLRLEVDVPSAGLVVDGDRERLVQVLTNLLANAGKFTPSGRRVRVSARRDAEAVVILVEDEGEGIAPELLPTIFDAFSQGPQGSDRPGGGLGLGLTISRNIVLGHEGTLTALSPGRDRGTTLVVRLPLLPRDRASPDPPAGDPAPPVSTLTPRRVLIVDDNDDAAEMLATFLGELGYATTVADAGPAALAVLEGSAHDVAILDIGLPGMDGYELAALVKVRLGERAPPLIALTGYAQQADRTRALAHGFAAHFAKPVDIDKLARTLAELCAKTPGVPPA